MPPAVPCSRSRVVPIAVKLEPFAGPAPSVVYRWDADTEILSAHLEPAPLGQGKSGSVGLEGSDGSWIILDLIGGQICAVEIAVWPGMEERPRLAAPTRAEDVALLIPAARSSREVRSVEVATTMSAECDALGRTFHFLVGSPREARVIRIASDILFEVDVENQISGVWLLNVPPCPSPS